MTKLWPLLIIPVISPKSRLRSFIEGPYCGRPVLSADRHLRSLGFGASLRGRPRARTHTDRDTSPKSRLRSFIEGESAAHTTSTSPTSPKSRLRSFIEGGSHRPRPAGNNDLRSLGFGASLREVHHHGDGHLSGYLRSLGFGASLREVGRARHDAISPISEVSASELH